MRGRSRGAAPAPVPAPRHHAAAALAVQPPLGRVDRRDETEHRAPAPAAFARTNFPVSTRGRGGRGGPVRAPLRNNRAGAADAMIMMKGVASAVTSVSTGAVSAPVSAAGSAMAVHVSKETKAETKKEPL